MPSLAPKLSSHESKETQILIALNEVPYSITGGKHHEVVRLSKLTHTRQLGEKQKYLLGTQQLLNSLILEYLNALLSLLYLGFFSNDTYLLNVWFSFPY